MMNFHIQHREGIVTLSLSLPLRYAQGCGSLAQHDIPGFGGESSLSWDQACPSQVPARRKISASHPGTELLDNDRPYHKWVVCTIILVGTRLGQFQCNCAMSMNNLIKRRSIRLSYRVVDV
jgi:hypothetical protein